MTPQELRDSILSLAIQGKLTERLSEDGAARELLFDSVVENNVDGQRVKEKIITEITDDEKAFDIPDTWEWIKLGNVCVIARGGSPRPIKEYITTAENGINWIKIGDTEKNGKYISATAEKIKPSGVSKSRMVHAGDFLLTNSMSFGRPYILKVDGCIHDGWLVISQTKEVFDQDYLYWLLSSNYAYMQFCGKVSGAVVKNLNSDKVANSVFPLPPLAEQKRIVAKIEELLPLIDCYEQAWSRLEEFNKRFPVDMQKSILQMAIQGKLVSQLHEEGTGEELYQQIQAEKQALIKAGKIKKEKPLPEITEDEIPFDIPDSWRWCRLSELVVLENGDRSSRYPVDTDYVTFGIPFFGAKDMSGRYMSFDNVRYISETKFKELGNGKLQDKDFICLLRGSVGKISQFKKNRNHETGFICAQMVIVRSVSSAIVDYLYTVMTSPYYFRFIESKTTGTAVRQLPAKELGNVLIPLPPLAEQKRIVAKLEEILPLCERLK